MPAITYTYVPGQTVWVITGGSCPTAVRTGDVSNVRINIISVGSPNTDEILYSIPLTGDNGPTTFSEVDVFVTLALATAEYETRLGITP